MHYTVSLRRNPPIPSFREVVRASPLPPLRDCRPFASVNRGLRNCLEPLSQASARQLVGYAATLEGRARLVGRLVTIAVAGATHQHQS